MLRTAAVGLVLSFFAVGCSCNNVPPDWDGGVDAGAGCGSSGSDGGVGGSGDAGGGDMDGGGGAGGGAMGGGAGGGGGSTGGVYCRFLIHLPGCRIKM